MKCSDGITCVHPSRVCDGINSCLDIDEDPQFCSNLTCVAGYWKCSNDIKCIENSKIGDGVDDCGDYSDELQVTCNDDEFTCSSTSSGRECL